MKKEWRHSPKRS